MTGWGDIQGRFAAALLDPAMAVPAGLQAPDGGACPQRFAVYRNNVMAGLLDCLRAVFPAVRRLVGDAFFDAMAAAFARFEPPRSPVLTEYGDGFAAFIAGFPAARGIPYLADVARLEWAWTEAYHAAEAEPLTAAALVGIDPDRVAETRLLLHPSLRLVRATSPALTIWRMNCGECAMAPVDVTVTEDALVVRPEALVEVRALPQGAGEFIDALLAGGTIGAATMAALTADPAFDLAAALVGMIEAGAVVGWQTLAMTWHHDAGATGPGEAA